MFKNFKGPAPLRVSFGAGPKNPTLENTQIGDVFTRQGAICMRVQERRPGDTRPDHRDIVNLQSGAVWAAHKDDEIQFVRAVLQVE